MKDRKESLVPEEQSPGFVLSFFSSLRTALYGEQQKEVKTLMRKKKMARKSAAASKKLGILQKVEEVGVERFLSPGPPSVDREFSGDENNDLDELVDIQPGALTIGGSSHKRQVNPGLYGELRAPGSPGQSRPEGLNPLAISSGRGPGRIVSPGDKRPAFPGSLGVPGKTGTGALLRTDLGTIPQTGSGHSPYRHQDFRSLITTEDEDSSFIGSLKTMFFGRKGGLL